MESECVSANLLYVGRCFLSAWFTWSWNLSLAFRHPPICKWKRLSSLLAITACELPLQCHHNNMLVSHMNTTVLMHLKQLLALILPRLTCLMVQSFKFDIHISLQYCIHFSLSPSYVVVATFVYPCNNILLLCHQTLYKNIMLHYCVSSMLPPKTPFL